jgi:MFS family permease
LASALKTSRLWFLLLAFLFQSTTLNMLAQHQPVYCQDIGFNEVFTSVIFSLFGIGMMGGTVSAFISDLIGREVTFIFATVGVVIGILAIMFACPTQEWLLYIYGIFFGFFSGVIGPTIYSGSADIFSGKHFGAINGFTLVGFGTGGALGPWLGGYIYDTTGNYTIAFVLAAIAVIISCVLFWFASPRKIKHIQVRN